jgi:hypothetical protein
LSPGICCSGIAKDSWCDSPSATDSALVGVSKSERNVRQQCLRSHPCGQELRQPDYAVSKDAVQKNDRWLVLCR